MLNFLTGMVRKTVMPSESKMSAIMALARNIRVELSKVYKLMKQMLNAKLELKLGS